jgi:hypothetical protein
MGARKPGRLWPGHLSRWNWRSFGACPLRPFVESSAVSRTLCCMRDFSPMETESEGIKGAWRPSSASLRIWSAVAHQIQGLHPRRLRPHPSARRAYERRGDNVRGRRWPGGGAGSRRYLGDNPRGPLIEVIERHTSRRVAGFMSSSHQHPDLISFVFVLDTSPLLEVIDGDGEGSG